MKVFKWNKQSLIEAAQGCKSKGELRKKHPGARSAGRRLGIWKKMCSHMPDTLTRGRVPANKKWFSVEDILPFSLQCKTKTEFYKRFPQAYQGAKDLKVLKEACLHMPDDASVGKIPYNKKWVYETILLEALKYDNKTDFARKSPGAYNAATALRILDEVCSHMGENSNKTKTIEEVRAFFENVDYKLVSSKYKNNNTKLLSICPEGHSYSVAFSHFQQGKRCSTCSLGNSSKMELELLETLKKHVPELTKAKFKVTVLSKSHIKAFEVDIYDPKKKIGIEFDGEHWHSFEHMRKDRKKRKWSDDDIRKYHDIKDSALLNCQGISVLHIKEEDWIADKQACIKRCLDFLGV